METFLRSVREHPERAFDARVLSLLDATGIALERIAQVLPFRDCHAPTSWRRTAGGGRLSSWPQPWATTPLSPG